MSLAEIKWQEIQPNIQMENPAYIVNPGNSLKAQCFLPQGVDPHYCNAVFDGLLKDVRLGHLDERRMGIRGHGLN